MILSTATEEIGHIEVLATAVAMNLEGAKSEQVDDVVTNPVVAARMGALEPRHFLTAGLAAMPSDANGVPFNASCEEARDDAGIEGRSQMSKKQLVGALRDR